MTATVTPIRQPPPPPGGAWRKRLVTRQTRHGDAEVIDCKANAVTILRNHPEWANILAFDELSQGIVCRRPAPWCPDDMPADMNPGRPWSDSDGGRIQNWLQRKEYLKLSETEAYKAAQIVAEANAFDPLRDWVCALRGMWDGSKRVGRWLTAYLGVEDTPYARFVGQAFLVGSIARALRPGCKMDTMLILEGEQGIFKSQAVGRLFGEWFRESPIDLRSNDRFLAVRGCWCREWPELDGWGVASVPRIRSFLSAQVDDFRAPYGRSMARAPRRCVFVATVNPPQLGYLVDEEGNRRMWPVSCGKVRPIDLDGVERDRVQIWAEALALFDAGVKWWPCTSEERGLCNQEQDQRMEVEVWAGRIAEWIGGGVKPRESITIRQLLTDCLQVPVERQDRSNSHRVGACLKRLGWVVGGREGSGERERYYVRKPDPDVEREGIVAEPARSP